VIAIIGRLLAPYALKLVGIFAITGAVAAILLGARKAGRNAERVERMRRTIEVQHDQLEAASRRPRDRNDLADRLRNGRF
jgi:hypothetical protein